MTTKNAEHAVLQSGTGSHEHDKHKNTPPHAERSQQSPQFVLADRVEYFLPGVLIEHCSFVFLVCVV